MNLQIPNAKSAEPQDDLPNDGTYVIGLRGGRKDGQSGVKFLELRHLLRLPSGCNRSLVD